MKLRRILVLQCSRHRSPSLRGRRSVAPRDRLSDREKPGACPAALHHDGTALARLPCAMRVSRLLIPALLLVPLAAGAADLDRIVPE